MNGRMDEWTNGRMDGGRCGRYGRWRYAINGAVTGRNVGLGELFHEIIVQIIGGPAHQTNGFGVTGGGDHAQ